jgi:SAM-dependent methyltransferase
MMAVISNPILAASPPNGVESGFFEHCHCPICGGAPFSIVKPEAYPPHLVTEELIQIYRSSSDHALMDRLVSCNRCGLLYLNPRIRQALILAGYSEAIDPAFVEQNEYRIAGFKRALSKACSKVLNTIGCECEVLDVGCGGGAFLKAAADMGYRGIGVEPSKWLCEFGKRQYGLELHPGTLAEQQFEIERFGIITLWDVLEHLSDPIAELKECRRILAKNGYLLLTFPDASSLASKMLGWKWPFWLSVHLYYFTPATMKKLLGKTGFELLAQYPYYPSLSVSYILHRAQNYFGSFSHLRAWLDRSGVGRWSIRYNMGQTAVIARKT